MSLILIFLYNKWNGCVLYSLGSCSTNLCVWLVFQQNAGKGCQSPLWRESVQVIPGYDLIALKDFEYSFEFVHFFLFASWSKFYFLTSFYLLQLLTFILFLKLSTEVWPVQWLCVLLISRLLLKPYLEARTLSEKVILFLWAQPLNFCDSPLKFQTWQGQFPDRYPYLAGPLMHQTYVQR